MTANTPNESGRNRPPLRRKQASEYIIKNWNQQASPKTLAKLATVGGGPVFRKAGRFPLYDPEDLDQWAASRIGPRRRSTSELVADDAGSHAGSNPSNPRSPRPVGGM